MEVLRELNFKLFKMFNKIGNKFYKLYVIDLRRSQGR